MKKLLIISILLGSASTLAKYKHPTPDKDNVLVTLGKSKSEALNPESIRILNWNLHKGTEPSLLSDLQKIGTNKDILLFQEMLLDKNMTNIFMSLKGFSYQTATSFFLPPDLYRTGVATASTIDSIETKFVRTELLEPAVNSPKVTLITRYPIAGTDKILTVANIHYINFVNAETFKIELERIYNELKKYPRPIIFAGDFNTWLGEKIHYLDQIRIALNLKEAQFTPDFRMVYNGYFLDHFLYSDDLHIKSSKVEKNYLGSDHKPLEVELEYNPDIF